MKNNTHTVNKNNHELKTLVGGFTLIEVMISIGLFTVIMIVGITAILGVNNTYRKTRTMRSAIDNLSYITEDMSRNIRLGYLYKCINTDDIDSTAVEEPADGENCKGVAFEPFWNAVAGDPGDQIAYFISEDTDGFGSIFKSTDGTDNYTAMNSLDLDIDVERSGFTVFGTSDADGEQPSVLITLVGTVSSGGNTPTEFNLQTTVSQRLLDIPPSAGGSTSTGGASTGTVPTSPTGPGGGSIPVLPTP